MKKKNKNETVEEVIEDWNDEETEEVQEEETEVKEKKDWKKIGKKVLKWTLLGAAGVAGVILVNAVASDRKEENNEEEPENQTWKIKDHGDSIYLEGDLEAKEIFENATGMELVEKTETE